MSQFYECRTNNWSRRHPAVSSHFHWCCQTQVQTTVTITSLSILSMLFCTFNKKIKEYNVKSNYWQPQFLLNYFSSSKNVYNENELKSLSSALTQVIQNFLASFKDNIQFICSSLTTLAKTLHVLEKQCLDKHDEGSQESDNIRTFCKERVEETVCKIKERLGRAYIDVVREISTYYWQQELEVTSSALTIPELLYISMVIWWYTKKCRYCKFQF